MTPNSLKYRLPDNFDEKVSVITVNYNGWRDTCAMIESLARHETYPYEILVVDNGSAGDDARQIAEVHPEVKVIRSEKNLGFAGGNNLALPYVTGRYLFFLNNDTEIKEPTLAVLVKRLQDPQVGGVSPLIRYFDEPDKIQYNGYWRITPITLRNTEPEGWVNHAHTPSCEIDVLHGAAMMVRRDVLEKVGPMREDYFLFYEEFDWSYNIADAGYHIWYDADAVIYHKEGRSVGKISPSRVYYMTRARRLFVHYHSHGWRKALSYCYLYGVVFTRDLISYSLKRRWDLVKALFTLKK